MNLCEMKNGKYKTEYYILFKMKYYFLFFYLVFARASSIAFNLSTRGG